MNQMEANQWKQDLKQMIQDRDPKDIFNVNETGSFYKCTPKNPFIQRSKMSRREVKQGKIDIFAGSNMHGSEKLPLLMIGKFANPRCFKNVKSKPIEYVNSSNTWMTSFLWTIASLTTPFL
uniref:DDE-1 domain-containing protein n=1 Tax=Homalodisca liturata TaxID=320908 RepID=A0A1B6HUN7_9HEMI